MMQHAAARRHAARRDHDRRLRRFLHRARLGNRGDHLQPRRAERARRAMRRRASQPAPVRRLPGPAPPAAIGTSRAPRPPSGCPRRPATRESAARLRDVNPVQQLLDAPERERRNDDLAAAVGRARDDLGQPRALVVGLVHAIAVGGLDEQHVGAVDRRRIRQHGPAEPAEIAAEQQRLARRLDRDPRVRRSEQMAGVDELDRDARHDRNRPVVADRLQQRHRARGVLRREERQRGRCFV